MDTEQWPGRGIGAGILVAGLAVLVVLGGSIFLGGQTSTILSNVGAAIPAGCCDDEPGSDQSDTVDDGKSDIADAGAAPPELLIIRTGHLEMEVVDLAASVTAARTAIAAVGGYVSASDETASGPGGSATAVYRIPAARWDDALDGIRGLATEIRQLQVETEAVTSQVADIAARITNLRASEAALQVIMAKASRIADVLDVQSELTAVRGEIEQLVAEQAGLEERAAFGTLTVTYRLPATPVTDDVRRGWDPATDVDQATGRLIGVGQAVVSLGIWFAIVGLPLLAAGGLLVAVGLRLRRLLAGRDIGLSRES